MIKSVQGERKLHDGDVIIAATAFLSTSLILTANRNDFPYPYFEEVEVTPILYQLDSQPGKTHCILLCLLNPNHEVITKYVKKKLAKNGDEDLYRAEQEDLRGIAKVEAELASARKRKRAKT